MTTSKKMRIPLRFDTEQSSTFQVRTTLSRSGLHTVCQEAACPNLWQCFSSGTATFLILGDRCTRNCRFCNIQTAKPAPPDPLEPEGLADSVQRMNLKYVVITSVTRDDLLDGGSEHFVQVVDFIRKKNPGIKVELLIPDFQGNFTNQKRVFDSNPDVLNHNLETVEELYSEVRPGANYRRSLDLLHASAEYGLLTKSGFMLGFGETDDQVKKILRDLKKTGTRIVTIGQYLPPTESHFPLVEMVSEERFSRMGDYARSLGFQRVESGPRVRSSYHAKETFAAGAGSPDEKQSVNMQKK